MKDSIFLFTAIWLLTFLSFQAVKLTIRAEIQRESQRQQSVLDGVDEINDKVGVAKKLVSPPQEIHISFKITKRYTGYKREIHVHTGIEKVIYVEIKKAFLSLYNYKYGVLGDTLYIID